jgi:hypothetical protein
MRLFDERGKRKEERGRERRWSDRQTDHVSFPILLGSEEGNAEFTEDERMK